MCFSAVSASIFFFIYFISNTSRTVPTRSSPVLCGTYRVRSPGVIIVFGGEAADFIIAMNIIINIINVCVHAWGERRGETSSTRRLNTISRRIIALFLSLVVDLYPPHVTIYVSRTRVSLWPAS